MGDIQQSLEIYKEQLRCGHIQSAYMALCKYIFRLEAGFPKQYHTGNVSFGYLDYSYFPFYNQYLRDHKLRFGVVLNHKELRFELWLMGQNADVQKKYWEIMKSSVWSSSEMPKYSVLEAVLEHHIDFEDEETMTENIISRALALASEIQQFLETNG